MVCEDFFCQLLAKTNNNTIKQAIIWFTFSFSINVIHFKIAFTDSYCICVKCSVMMCKIL